MESADSVSVVESADSVSVVESAHSVSVAAKLNMDHVLDVAAVAVISVNIAVLCQCNWPTTEICHCRD